MKTPFMALATLSLALVAIAAWLARGGGMPGGEVFLPLIPALARGFAGSVRELGEIRKKGGLQ